MRKRAEQVEQTRQRIIAATVRLHTSVGPARTTVTAIAEEAGVTRLTVYRHFPELQSLFEACGRQWTRQHPPPDPAAWRVIRDVETRARHALRELYAWYRANERDLLPIYRDVESMPAAARRSTHDEVEAFADALVAGSGVRGHARRRLRAVAGHVVGFWTWRSLAVEQGLDDAETADLATALLAAATRR